MDTEKDQAIKMEAELITANPSTHRNIMDYSPKCNLVCYASGSLIYIHSPESAQNFCSLRGHTSNVNVVKWVDHQISNTYDIISAGADKAVIYWRCVGSPKIPKNWNMIIHITSHKESVELLSVLPLKNEILFMSYSIDGDACLCKCGDISPSPKTLQVLKFQKTLLECMSMVALNENLVLMAFGGFNNCIQIFIYDMGTQKASYKASLTGYQNSVRDIAITQVPGSSYHLMATGSMDGVIRLWKIRPMTSDVLRKEIGGGLLKELQEYYQSKTSYVIDINSKDLFYNVSLESVLTGHSEGISCLKWGRNLKKGLNGDMELCLLSGSSDSTVCCWCLTKLENGVWENVSTFGETAGPKNAVYGAHFTNPNSSEILIHLYNGALFRWVYNDTKQKWESALALTGHFESVNDVIWDPSNQFVITCSSDMQTKIYGKVNHKEWREISRPQIHGYEINSVVAFPMFDGKGAPFKIVSAAEEKVLRIFDPPFAFLKTGNELCGAEFKFSQKCDNATYEASVSSGKSSQASASVSQPLGLMNKPLVTGGENEEDFNPYSFNPEGFLSNKIEQQPEFGEKEKIVAVPQEHFLGNFGLWPETQKLYGHAYEVQAIAISYDYKFLATSASATKPKDAYICLWEISTSKLVGKLFGHQLSVTQMSFSHNGKMLLSVGRDRQWILYGGESVPSFAKISNLSEADTRMIFACQFAPDDKLFLTASRNKKNSLKVWNLKELHSSISHKSFTVTAAAFLKTKVSDSYRIIAGSLEGHIIIFEKFPQSDWTLLYQLDDSLSHDSRITRIAINQNNEETRIATASADRSLRIFKLIEKREEKKQINGV